MKSIIKQDVKKMLLEFLFGVGVGIAFFHVAEVLFPMYLDRKYR